MKIHTTDACLLPTFSAPLPSSPSLPSPALPINNEHCNICQKNVKDTEKGIQCDSCDEWVHTKCEKIPDLEYYTYIIEQDKQFICKKCRKCNICDKTIAKNHKKLKCQCCLQFIHPITCNKMNDRQYKSALVNPDDFECRICFASKFPFSTLTDNLFKITVSNGVLNPDNV